MNIWKVIFATLVIFASGVLTGGFLEKNAASKVPLPAAPRPTRAPTAPWFLQRREFSQRMEKELKLTPDQVQRFREIIRDSREHTEPIWDMIRPLLEEEEERVLRDIRSRAQLTPEQTEKFEKLLKESKQPRRPPHNGGKPAEGSRPPAKTD